ncbi:hypothetical protein CI109_103194 [Kwoniella shandongensis]|uniref:Probable RNA polymerase II nuclear localization protein SLC7A6OS n=1 Tax=Kwoniella shandongensis TaxID=1734106 RepID=A0A5M6C952_9TREE|nr:uncharacterized protein CI109_000385 [Kwoniella shandongensis]KAA5531543.1 hypothetical protein CI109_000385 [Kwoniella shandongensis]
MSTYPPSVTTSAAGSSSAALPTDLDTMPGPSTEAYTVLRIKRKATEAPLSSLVIQDTEPRQRAKRRRDISGRPRGVFRLAETVPGTWVGKGEEGEVLKTRIQDLLSSSQKSSPVISSGQIASPTALPKSISSPPPISSPTTIQAPPPPLAASSSDVLDQIQSPSSTRHRGSNSNAQVAQTQYRVVPPISPRTKSMLPPRIMTTAETEAGPSPLVFVDAQAVSSSGPSRQKPSNLEEEKEMAAFLPMLEEYLRLEKSQTKEIPTTPAEDEWVYDLYYRDNRGSAPLHIGAGDGVTIGQLLGFEDISPPSSISGSEPEDEADEDSNDEDYYRNDYPEDEDADEDMEGYRGGGGESDEDCWSEEEGDGDDSDDRGEWGYRD